jgi:hypothetical protein
VQKAWRRFLEGNGLHTIKQIWVSEALCMKAGGLFAFTFQQGVHLLAKRQLVVHLCRLLSAAESVQQRSTR